MTVERSRKLEVTPFFKKNIKYLWEFISHRTERNKISKCQWFSTDLKEKRERNHFQGKKSNKLKNGQVKVFTNIPLYYISKQLKRSAKLIWI